jgi:hypothetical protein
MAPQSQIAQKLDSALPSPRIRSLQVLYLALMGSVSGLTLMAIWMGFMVDHPPLELRMPLHLRNLALVAAAIPLLIWPLSRLVFDWILRHNAVFREGALDSSQSESVFRNVQSAWVLKAALVEIGALSCLGVLLMLLFVRDPLHLPLLYYGVLSGPALMMVHTMAYYPSRETILAQFRRLAEED